MRRSMIGRWLVFALLGLIAACGPDAAEMPLEPQFAKGGVKGPPDKDDGSDDDQDDGAAEDPALVEYWVMPDVEADGTDVIHLVFDAEVERAGAGIVQDYFHNGMRDDNHSDHYEYYQHGPQPGLPELVGDGWYHLDLVWNGERRFGDNDYGPFPDFPTTDLDGTGADPFAFSLEWAMDADIYRVQPQGVVADGQELGAEASGLSSVTGLHDDWTDAVTSYAKHDGDAPAGTIAVAELAFDNVQCRVETIRTGRGRNKTTETVTEVSADASVTLAGAPGPVPNVWLEWHLQVGDGVLGDRSSISRDFSDDPTYDFSVTTQLNGDYAGEDLRVIVDYVFAPGDSDHVYDPAANDVTTLGSDGNAYTPAAAVGDPWAVAMSAPVPCEGD